MWFFKPYMSDSKMSDVKTYFPCSLGLKYSLSKWQSFHTFISQQPKERLICGSRALVSWGSQAIVLNRNYFPPMKIYQVWTFAFYRVVGFRKTPEKWKFTFPLKQQKNIWRGDFFFCAAVHNVHGKQWQA